MMNRYFKRTLNYGQDSYGKKRQDAWLEDMNKPTGYLPQGISIKDIDEVFKDMVSNDLSPIVKLKRQGGVVEEPMPVIFMTMQRWSEFTKTWDMTLDEFKDITLPFITINRNNDIQVGTNQQGYYNIAGRRNWIYVDVPTYEGGRRGVDKYKIPQPTSIDLTYEVRVFTTRINDQNKASEKIHTDFNALQKYIVVKGNPMPVKLESIVDESQLDLEERKFFISTYEMVVQGYILNEDDFEVVASVNRIATSFETNHNSKLKGRKMIAKGNIVLFDVKNKKIIEVLKDADVYRLKQNVSVFSGTKEEFCTKSNNYDGC